MKKKKTQLLGIVLSAAMLATSVPLLFMQNRQIM